MSNLKWYHWLIIFILITIVGNYIFIIVNGKAAINAQKDIILNTPKEPKAPTLTEQLQSQYGG